MVYITILMYPMYVTSVIVSCIHPTPILDTLTTLTTNMTIPHLQVMATTIMVTILIIITIMVTILTIIIIMVTILTIITTMVTILTIIIIM